MPAAEHRADTPAAGQTPSGPSTKQWFARISAALFARRISVGLILVAAILAFAYFWPIYTGEVIPFSAWNNRMWNITWR
ncbi:hypothetical protein D3I60_19060 [Brevibacterium permense]|nr:hypothetical protein [Brevibacterium permense]